MTTWIDISAGRIAAGEPPTAELFSALRGRDLADATKPLNIEHMDGAAATSQASSWASVLTFRLWIPADVPSGFWLYLPVNMYVVKGTDPFTAYIADWRLSWASNTSSTFSTSSVVATTHGVLGMEVPSGEPGTTATITVEGQMLDNATASDLGDIKTATPDANWAPLASIRAAP